MNPNNTVIICMFTADVLGPKTTIKVALQNWFSLPQQALTAYSLSYRGGTLGNFLPVNIGVLIGVVLAGFAQATTVLRVHGCRIAV